MTSVICNWCGKQFETLPHYIKRGGGKFCSTTCYYKSIKGRKPSHTGTKMVVNVGKKNGNWKGNQVGYEALHVWVKRRLEKPRLCQRCNIKSAYDLANKGIYNRDLKNWWWICRSCHMIIDGRMNNLKQYSNIKP
jgi:hypothetical protein